MTRLFWIQRAVAGAFCVLAAAWACSDAPNAPQDTRAPTASIVFPPANGALYDRDSNGLVDLEVAWRDSLGAVDPTSVRVTCTPSCIPGVPQDSNLAAGWRVARRDAARFLLEENLPLLLREGARTLTVTVADSAGNVSTPARVTVTLPPGAYHKSISLEGRPTCQPERGVNFAFSPDGTKGFAPFHFCVAVFDPDGRQPTRFIDGVPNVGWAAFISVDSSTGLAYIGGGGTETAGFTILDTRTEQVVGTKVVGQAMAAVVVDGDRIFAGESCTNGRIFVYDKRTLAELGRIEIGAVSYLGSCPNSAAFAFSSDHRTGWAGVVGAGVVRFDPIGLTRVAYYDIQPGEDNYLGDTRDIALVGDHWLYLARVREGLDLYQDEPWLLLARVPSGCCYVGLAVSPTRDQMVVNVTSTVMFGGVFGTAPQLYEVPMGLSLRYAYPPRLGHLTDAVVFHPDGKRFFVMAEFQVYVYLVRSR